MWLQLRDPAALAGAMQASGHSVRSLAKTTGVGPAMIGHLRTGERDTTTRENAQRISDALGVPLEQMWTIRNGYLLKGTP